MTYFEVTRANGDREEIGYDSCYIQDGVAVFRDSNNLTPQLYIKDWCDITRLEGDL